MPESLRTLIAVPTLLTTVEDIAAQVEQLEIHHLASPDGDLHFALLSDWTDADAEQKGGDAELLAFARESIEGQTDATVRLLRARAFCCFIGSAFGTTAKGYGSVGSASAANCTS